MDPRALYLPIIVSQIDYKVEGRESNMVYIYMLMGIEL